MKDKLLVALILFPLSLKAQLMEFFKNPETDFSTWEIVDENKGEMVRQILNDGHFKEMNLERQLNDFHILDFDLDGQNDLIFYGYYGGESKYLHFFKNEDNSFKEILALAGRLVFTSKNDNSNTLSFAINQYGCCASFNNVFEVYKPVERASIFEYTLTEKIAFIRGTEFPTEDYIRSVEFETINPEYTIRTSPVLDNESELLPPSDYDMKGNSVAIYPPKSRGKAIAEKTDSTGRVWYFVVMENNLKPIKDILYEGANNDATFKTMGWMSSRYIRKI